MNTTHTNDVQPVESMDILTPDENQTFKPSKAQLSLRDARLAKNLSLQEVSNQLRLSVKQIEALEMGDFTHLPQPMIVRGFIRNYARLLGLDATPFIDAYKVRVPEVTLSPYIVETSINQPISTRDKQPWPKYLIGGSLLLLSVLAWLYYMSSTGMPIKLDDLTKQVGAFNSEKNTPASLDSTPATSTEPLPEIALPAAERDNVESLPAVGDAKIVASQVITSTENTQPLDHNKSLVKTEVQGLNTNLSSMQKNAVPNIPSLKTDTTLSSAENISTTTNKALPKLSFNTKQESWINITDLNGRVLYSKVLPVGGQDALEVNANALPINVIVGNINGTSLSFKGSAIDLTTHAKLNVAKFQLK